MSTPSTEGTSADHSRSGDDIAEAIDVAERGSAVEEVHGQGTEATSGAALGTSPGTSPGPTEQSSGVAQSQTGARPSDQIAAGEDATGS